MLTLGSELLVSMVERLPFMVAVKDARSRRYVHANRAFCNLVERSPADVDGRLDEELFSEPVARALEACAEQALAERRPVHAPDVTLESSSGPRILALEVSPLGPADAPTHLVITGQDVTEQRRKDGELAEQRAFVRQVIDSDPSLVFVKDRRGNFILVNQAVADSFGKPIEELEHKPNRAVHVNDAEVDHFDRVDQEVLRTGHEVVVEEPFTCADGSLRWYQTVKRPLVRLDGEVQILGVSMDITERKTAQATLEDTLHALSARAAETQREAEEKAALVRELDDKLATIEQQHREILALSVPMLDLAEGVLGVPIIGRVDERRAREIMERLLTAIVDRQAESVVIDLTGLDAVDQSVLEQLGRIIQATSLLGAQATVTGISPAVARTLTELGFDTSTFRTLRTLREFFMRGRSPLRAARGRSPTP
jgi:rsbT co-antagonist protein RsbR